MGVCLSGANIVMSRTHLRQDTRALSRSLERSLPLSLSLSRSLSPRSLARSLGVCVHARMRRCVNEAFRNGDTSADVSRSQSHKARAFRDGGASADVSRHRGLWLQDAPPLECCVRSDELPVSMRMHFCRGPMRMTLSCSAYTCVCLKLLSRFRETILIDFDLHAGSSYILWLTIESTYIFTLIIKS